MTPERREQIETLLARITPGEWTWRESFFDPAYPVAAYSDLRIETPTPDKPWDAELAYVLQPLTTGVILGRSADTTFIAAAPGIVRELLAEVERLNVELGTVQGMLQAVTGETFPVEQLWDDLENEDD